MVTYALVLPAAVVELVSDVIEEAAELVPEDATGEVVFDAIEVVAKLV